jgi:hypothetical protein
MQRLHARPGNVHYLFEFPVARDQKQVRLSIIVEIDDARAPSGVPRFHAESRAQGHVAEVALASFR